MATAPDAAHAAPPAKNPGPTARIWGAIGIVIGVLVGLIVLFYVARFLLPEMFNEFNGTLSVASTGLTESGIRLGLVGSSVGIFGGGGFALYIRVMVYVLLFAVVAWGISILLDKIRAGRAGGGDAHH